MREREREREKERKREREREKERERKRKRKKTAIISKIVNSRVFRVNNRIDKLKIKIFFP